MKTKLTNASPDIVDCKVCTGNSKSQSGFISEEKGNTQTVFLQVSNIELLASHFPKKAREIAQVIPFALDLFVKLKGPSALNILIANGPVISVKFPCSLSL